MSFHAGQTFTFGEQPSATKWQYLWDNDYALADGTGISNDAIINRHIAAGVIAWNKNNLSTWPIMRRIASTNTSLSTAATSVNVASTDYSQGSGLSTSGNTGILIGSGITLVRVSAVIIADSMSDTYLFSRCRRNRGGVFNEFTSQLGRAASGFASSSHPGFDLSVQSGDIIDVRVDVGTGTATLSNGRPQWLQVEAIG